MTIMKDMVVVCPFVVVTLNKLTNLLIFLCLFVDISKSIDHGIMTNYIHQNKIKIKNRHEK